MDALHCTDRRRHHVRSRTPMLPHARRMAPSARTISKKSDARRSWRTSVGVRLLIGRRLTRIEGAGNSGHGQARSRRSRGRIMGTENMRGTPDIFCSEAGRAATAADTAPRGAPADHRQRRQRRRRSPPVIPVIVVWQGDILIGRRARIGGAGHVAYCQAFSAFSLRSRSRERGAFSGRSDAKIPPFSRLDNGNGARGRTPDAFFETERCGRRGDGNDHAMQGANNSGCRIPGQRRRTPRCREILPLTGGDGGDGGDAALTPGGGRRAAGRYCRSPAATAATRAMRAT